MEILELIIVDLTASLIKVIVRAVPFKLIQKSAKGIFTEKIRPFLMGFTDYDGKKVRFHRGLALYQKHKKLTKIIIKAVADPRFMKEEFWIQAKNIA